MADPKADEQATMTAGHAAHGREHGIASAVQRLRFIPFRRSDLLQMLREEPAAEAALATRFEATASHVEEHFAAEFHGLRQAIKDSYAPCDPDADTRSIEAAQDPGQDPAQGDDASDLRDRLASLLERANYEQLTESDLKRAFRSSSLFQIRLRVNLRAFDETLLYCRGASQREETLSSFGGLFKRRVRFINYDRVVLYLRAAETGGEADDELQPGRVMIKLFQNVPDADLEMLFPNTRVGMRWVDRLLIGVPALASGAVVAFTKLSAPLVLLGALIGFWLGLRSEPVALDRQGLIVIGAGLAALLAYIWKQWSGYRNRKARFRQALTRNLYFKLLDNNAGVLLRVLDDAEDSECKEAWLALRFLLDAPEGLAARELDERIEAWFRTRWQAELDFEIDDALGKLERLGLATHEDDRWRLTLVEDKPA